jgi:hypothetical protein
MAMLRMIGRPLHSNYGPTADTGGLAGAATVYAYPSVEALLDGAAHEDEAARRDTRRTSAGVNPA